MNGALSSGIWSGTEDITLAVNGILETAELKVKSEIVPRSFSQGNGYSTVEGGDVTSGSLIGSLEDGAGRVSVAGGSCVSTTDDSTVNETTEVQLRVPIGS
jgi:hypothetical protein